MMRTYLKSGSPHGIEVCSVAPFTGAVHVLDKAPLVALNEIVSSRARRASCLKGEGELSQHGGLTEDGKRPDRDPAHGRLGARGDEIDVVLAAPDESRQQPRRGRLHAAMEREGPADQRDLHRGPLACSVTCVMRGKRSRRAEVKLYRSTQRSRARRARAAASPLSSRRDRKSTRLN